MPAKAERHHFITGIGDAHFLLQAFFIQRIEDFRKEGDRIDIIMCPALFRIVEQADLHFLVRILQSLNFPGLVLQESMQRVARCRLVDRKLILLACKGKVAAVDPVRREKNRQAVGSAGLLDFLQGIIFVKNFGAFDIQADQVSADFRQNDSLVAGCFDGPEFSFQSFGSCNHGHFLL